MMPIFENFNHKVIESQNHLGWIRPLRPSSPIIKLTPPSPPLNHVSKYYVYMAFRHLQGWGLPTSLGSLVRCLTTLPVKKFFVISIHFILFKTIYKKVNPSLAALHVGLWWSAKQTNTAELSHR